MDASADILHLDQDRWEKLVVRTASGVDIIQSAGLAWQEEQQPKPERVRFILRFVRSLYQFIVVDLGRFDPISTRMAREMGQLFLVSACDVLALNEAKWAIHGLHEAGFSQSSIHLLLNQAPRKLGFHPAELEKILGVPVYATLPESKPGFIAGNSEEGPLAKNREFQKSIAHMAAGIAGLKKEGDAKGPFSFLTDVLRHATK
jgi:Flp pilus assembly CpaE family ATPase